jgi:hypothetical protein
MSATRRTRAAASAAALSAALVVGMTGTAFAFEDLDCDDFTYQAEAQAVLDEDISDPHLLDGGQDGPPDGVACGSLPHREDADVPTTTPTPEPEAPATTPPAAPVALAGDRDCPDFATQADAQAVLGSGADPERLDADDDGIACEQHFGTEGRQVAVFPVGGVATGGPPRQ